MTMKATKFLTTAAALAAGVALALPAAAEPAKPEKPKRQVTTTTNTQSQAQYRGTDKFRAGPLYFQEIYLGDDPDPFIRSQIQRDIGARFPGSD